MITVSGIKTTARLTYKTELEAKVYETLAKLGIPFRRVDTGEAITMEDCQAIDQAIGLPIVKSLFLCDRQQEHFYLYILPGDQRFDSKAFSQGLGISRVSFAPKELFETMLQAKIGAATLLSALVDPQNKIRIVIDSSVAMKKEIGISDGTDTCFMILKTQDVLKTLLPSANHPATIL